MKKILALTLAVIMMLAVVALPVMAGDSPGRPVDDVIIEATDKNGKDITPEIRLEINDESRKAEAELTDEKIAELLGDKYNDDIVLGDVYDVIYTGNAYPIEIKAKQNVAKDDVAFVITKVNGEWIVVDKAVIADGSITFPLDEDSVIAFVYERIPGEIAPPTGTYFALISVIVLVSLAGTVYCTKRTVA